MQLLDFISQQGEKTDDNISQKLASKNMENMVKHEGSLLEYNDKETTETLAKFARDCLDLHNKIRTSHQVSPLELCEKV